ncbi:hypothetical protein HK096_000550, partial [Nowakowskiella sp. JEL0078]
MMEMFFAAAGTSAVIFGITSNNRGYLGDRIRISRSSFLKRHNDRGILSSSVGSIILGIGMGISGACPGTLYAQIGAGVSGWLNIIAGGITGTLTYFVLENSAKQILHLKLKVKTESKIDQFLPFSYHNSAIFLGIILWFISLGLYFYAPNSSVEIENPSIFNFIFLKAWPSPVSGFLIGILQLGFIVNLDVPIGMSSAFIGFVAPLYPVLRSLGLVTNDSNLKSWTLSKSINKIIGLTAVAGGSFVSVALSGLYGEVPGLL